jgi:hypothetical protein
MNLEPEDQPPTLVVSGDVYTRLFSKLALRRALRMEIQTGMKRRGRPSTVIANEYMGTAVRGRRKVYEAFDKWLVENYGSYGIESVPLEDRA